MKVQNGDILRRLDEIQRSLADRRQPKPEEQGPVTGYKVYVPGLGGKYESSKERGRREANDSSRVTYLSTGVADRRMAEGYFSAVLGYVKVDRDTFKSAALIALDFLSNIQMGKEELRKVGSGSRLGQWKSVILALGIAGAVAVVLSSALQPGTFQILSNDFGTERSQFIVAGIAVVLGGAFVASRLWERRSRRKAQ